MTLQQIQQNPFLNAVVAPYLQPGAQYQQTQAQIPLTQQETQTSAQSAATSGQEQQNLQAQNPGIQAQAQSEQVAALQAKAKLGLNTDLKNKMTLPSAMGKYKALGMSADDILNQYISESPYGFPNQTPTELHNMGVSDKVIGQPGQANTYADRYNTKNALNEINTMQQVWNNTSPGDRLAGELGLNKNSRLYDQAKTAVGEHISSLIPGGSNAQGSVDQLTGMFPDIHDLRVGNDTANSLFNQAKKLLMQQKGYTSQDLDGASSQPQTQDSPGKQLLTTLTSRANEGTGGNKIHVGENGTPNGALPLIGGIGAPLVSDALTGGLALPANALISGAGASAGQLLQDRLYGIKPGADVATTGAASAIGELTGGVGSKIAGKIGGALISKVPDNVFNNVVSATPNLVTKISDLKNVASKYGLMDGSVMDGLNKMPGVMEGIGNKIQSALTKNTTPINLSDVSSTVLKDFDKNSSSFNNSQDFENAQKFIKDRIFQGTGNNKPLSELFGANGQKVTNSSAQTTYSDIYKLKSQVANDLKPVFKAQENPAANANFTPKQEANLSLWNGLKKVLDGAGPEIRQLNSDQHAMFTIAKGFGKNMGKSGGGVMNDVIDATVGSMVGGHPLAGMIMGRIARNPSFLNKLGGGLTSGALQKGLPAVGAASGAGLGAILGMQ